MRRVFAGIDQFLSPDAAYLVETPSRLTVRFDVWQVSWSYLKMGFLCAPIGALAGFVVGGASGALGVSLVVVGGSVLAAVYEPLQGAIQASGTVVFDRDQGRVFRDGAPICRFEEVKAVLLEIESPMESLLQHSIGLNLVDGTRRHIVRYVSAFDSGEFRRAADLIASFIGVEAIVVST